MASDDRGSDVRLRQSARATLARFEADVDGDAAMTDFRRRVAAAEVPEDGATRDHARGTRWVLAIAGAMTLVVGGVAVLAWPHTGSQLVTVSPETGDTKAGSTPSTSRAAATSTSPKTENSTTSAQRSLAPQEVDDLIGRTWIITEVDGSQRPFVAHFEMSSGRITGHDGCNRYGATLQVTAIVDGEATIELHERESTAVQCLGFEDEGWWSAPNGRYRVDDNALTITATDGHTYEAVDLEALEMVNSPEQIVGVWTVRGGASIEFAEDGTIRLPCAAIGTWTFEDGLRTEIDQSADTRGCEDLGLDPLGSTYEALVSTSPVIRILPDGSLLVESSAFGRLLPSSASVDEPPDTVIDPADVDMLAGWPAPPAVVPDLTLLPLLLPAEPLVDMSNAVRREGVDSAATNDYTQVWTAGSDGTQLLVVTTNLAQHSSLSPLEVVDVGSWDLAYFASSASDIAHLQLDDPSGFVDINGFGMSQQEVLAVAVSLTMRHDGQPGWTLSGPDEPLTAVHEGWRLDAAWRNLTWSAELTVLELDILWGVPDFVVPGMAGAQTISIDIHDTPAIGYTVGGVLAAIAWSPSPDVIVRVGARGLTLDELATIATSMRAVNEATWNAASEPDPSTSDGCHSIFC